MKSNICVEMSLGCELKIHLIVSFFSSQVSLTVEISSTQVLSQAQHEPGYCAFYEECGRNPLIEGSLIPPIVPCLNYSRARQLTGQHYRKLKQVCICCLLFQ